MILHPLAIQCTFVAYDLLQRSNHIKEREKNKTIVTLQHSPCRKMFEEYDAELNARLCFILSYVASEKI
jgi:hypothetical protein